MSQRIFISYRRVDTADFTVALYNELRKYYADSQVFKDINNIPPGLEFGDVLRKALDESSVVLAVIGPEYISAAGTRLFDEADWVRQELAQSLERKLRVVPILVNGAEMPTMEQLPPDVQPLRKRQAHRIDNGSFEYDVKVLVDGIKDLVPPRPTESPTNTSTGKTQSFDNAFKALLLFLMLCSIGLISFAWIFSDDGILEKVVMSGLGGGGLLGGWAAFTRQRWLELRQNQLKMQ